MIETKKDIERNLPKGWRWERLGNIVDLQAGIAFKKSEYSKEGVRLFQIANVSFNYIKWEEIEYLPKNYINTYPNLLLHPGDIVMALNRPLLNDKLKIAEIRNSDTPAILYQRVGRFKFLDNESSRYFLFFLQSPSFISWLKDQLQGVNIPFINKSKLLSFNHYPKCLLATQQAIVSKIEELFSELDKGIENLRTAQQQLKTYRQAVLKWAFEGRLTNENVKDGELPKGWKVVLLKEISKEISDGDHQAPPKSKSGVPFITISNVKKCNNKIDFSKTFLVSQEYYAKLKINRKPFKGDVLYTVTGSFGIPVLIDFDKEFCFQRHIGLVRPSDITNQKWLYYLLQSPDVFNQAKSTATGTAQKTVALNSLRNFQVPFCKLVEQNKIVQEIETRLSVAEKMEESITQSLQQAEGLRQSILKKAFEGELNLKIL